MIPQQVVALLPMKAHSERVPGKNFKTFNGKPLFQWILETLLLLPEIQQVVINTDARELLADHGLEESERVQLRDRQPDLCGDNISMNRILANDVAAVPADIYLMTHTTNPLLAAGTIRRALQKFQQAHAKDQIDSLFSVNRFQTRFYRADGSAINHDPDNLIRTQDLESWYEENSCLYLFTAKSFETTQARIGKRSLLFETPRLESLDIDDSVDWYLAETVAQKWAANSNESIQ